MNSVTQLDPLGCGAACISFITGKNYAEVVTLLGQSQAEHRGFYCGELIAVLSKLGISYTYKYIKPWLRNRIYQNKAIVFIKRSESYPAGHYLVRYKGQWMDPWINFCENSNITQAKSGFRKKLPGMPIYALFPPT